MRAIYAEISRWGKLHIPRITRHLINQLEKNCEKRAEGKGVRHWIEPRKLQALDICPTLNKAPGYCISGDYGCNQVWNTHIRVSVFQVSDLLQMLTGARYCLWNNLKVYDMTRISPLITKLSFVNRIRNTFGVVIHPIGVGLHSSSNIWDTKYRSCPKSRFSLAFLTSCPKEILNIFLISSRFLYLRTLWT